MIKFITGNSNKFNEVQAMLRLPIEQLNIDLPEIQSLDPQEVIRAKLEAALQHHKGSLMVEDNSMNMEALNGLPGPFIKWFEHAMGNDGLVDLVQKLGNSGVRITSTIGYAAENGTIEFFQGTLTGRIVPARGAKDFGWGPIFQPDGHDRTFGEMGNEEKFTLGYRGEAVRKLRDFLNKQNR